MPEQASGGVDDSMVEAEHAVCELDFTGFPSLQRFLA